MYQVKKILKGMRLTKYAKATAKACLRICLIERESGINLGITGGDVMIYLSYADRNSLLLFNLFAFDSLVEVISKAPCDWNAIITVINSTRFCK